MPLKDRWLKWKEYEEEEYSFLMISELKKEAEDKKGENNILSHEHKKEIQVPQDHGPANKQLT